MQCSLSNTMQNNFENGSIESSFCDVKASTYQKDFTLLPRKYYYPEYHYQQKCFECKDGLLKPRCFPVSFPRFPGRILAKDRPAALGLGSFTVESVELPDNPTEGEDSGETKVSSIDNELEEDVEPVDGDSNKDNSKEDEFEEENFNKALQDSISGTAKIPKIIVAELVKAACYTPSSNQYGSFLTNQNKINLNLKPIDHERLADQVRYKPIVSECKPDVWQTIGRHWDRDQIRGGIKRNHLNIEKLPSNNRLLCRARVNGIRPNPGLTNGLIPTDPNYKERDDEESIRPPPGYGGFVPRLPVHSRSLSRSNAHFKTIMTTTSQRAYRAYSKEDYIPLSYFHKGPLSKTVTLTQPFNPFNKIDLQPINIK